MGIKIGNNNKIKNSNIGKHIELNNQDKKSFFNRHPIFSTVIIPLIIGFLFLFSFWDKVVSWIESLFI